MKKVLILASALLALIFTGCGSIPNPEKASNLLYGKATFELNARSNNHSFPEHIDIPDNIHITFQNLENHRKYTATTNKNGEIILSNLPAGRYKVHSVTKSIMFGTYEGTPQIYEDGVSNFHYFFNMPEKGVMNLGIMDFKMNYQETTGNYYTYTYSFTMKHGTTEVENDFLNDYPDSAWLDQEWINAF